MAKKKNIDTARVDELIKAYETIYLNRTRDFNALTTVHLSENDHTNIMCEILNMKVGDKKPFMESFVREVLGLTSLDCKKLVAKTQQQAISAKGLGFIDLLIEGDGKYIIIENKVCGAGDGPFQLARYYFSYIDNYNNFRELLNDCSWGEFKKDEQKYASALDTQYGNWWRTERKSIDPLNLYIVYLTDTTDKEPSKNSFPDDLKNALDKHYIPISYEEHIYDWLKNTVLPKIPFGKTGDAHNSIILYLRELENIFASNTAQNQWYLKTKEIEDFINAWILSKSNDNVSKYDALNKEYNHLKEAAKQNDYKNNSILADLISCVLCWRNNVFGKYAPEGWTVYCVGIYVIFYPTRWLEKFGGTTYSNIHFTLTNWNGDDKKRKMNFDIDYSACRKYLMKDEKIYGSHYDQLMAQTENIRITDQDRDLVNFKAADEKFKKSNHYYWHIFLDPEKIATKWNPNDDEAIKNFFRNFVECDEIKKVIDYIDSAFK